MATKKSQASIFFKDADGIERFLFRIINYGKHTDELKFMMIHPNSKNYHIYSKDGKMDLRDTEMRKYSEISYHSDGSLLWKLPNTKDGQPTIIDNVNDPGDRRTPIAKIREWEPVILGNIIKYVNCTPGITDDAQVIPSNTHVFNGGPFEYCAFLGHKVYADPPNNGENELLFRVNDITENIDMIIWLYKSHYHGRYEQLGDTTIFINSNMVRIAERKLSVKNGAIEINLDLLHSPNWNADIVDDNFKLNMLILRHQPPKTMVCKVYLKSNPHLRQLSELIGYNKTFVVTPLFNRKPLGITLAGFLDKDDEGEFFSFGTRPDL